MCLKENEYQCAMCKGVFEKGQTDEEADIEFQENFPEDSDEEEELICDHCFTKMFH